MAQDNAARTDDLDDDDGKPRLHSVEPPTDATDPPHNRRARDLVAGILALICGVGEVARFALSSWTAGPNASSQNVGYVGGAIIVTVLLVAGGVQSIRAWHRNARGPRAVRWAMGFVTLLVLAIAVIVTFTSVGDKSSNSQAAASAAAAANVKQQPVAAGDFTPPRGWKLDRSRSGKENLVYVNAGSVANVVSAQYQGALGITSASDAQLFAKGVASGIRRDFPTGFKLTRTQVLGTVQQPQIELNFRTTIKGHPFVGRSVSVVDVQSGQMQEMVVLTLKSQSAARKDSVDALVKAFRSQMS